MHVGKATVTIVHALSMQISINLDDLFVYKGKEEYLYSTILADTPLTKRSDMDHTVLPANYTMSAFPS